MTMAHAVSTVALMLALGRLGGLIDDPAAAATLKVGQTRVYKLPSDAAAVARDGDTIALDAGDYRDCAVWRANRLTIAGEGPGVRVRIREKACEGKGLFVIAGNDIVVKNLELSGAHVRENNGAGIRAEGINLKIEGVYFLDNENGVLASSNADSTIEISKSVFLRNGSCESPAGCAHGIYVGHIARLVVRDSKFSETRDGHHIKSRAARTEVIGNEIRDGDRGTASYLVDVPEGGSLLLEHNTLEKGPLAGNRTAAVAIGAEGLTQPTPELIVRGNTFSNDCPTETVFVRNLTETAAAVSGNTLYGKIVPLTGPGLVR